MRNSTMGADILRSQHTNVRLQAGRTDVLYNTLHTAADINVHNSICLLLQAKRNIHRRNNSRTGNDDNRHNIRRSNNHTIIHQNLQLLRRPNAMDRTGRRSNSNGNSRRNKKIITCAV